MSFMPAVGTFATCLRVLRMSVYRVKPDMARTHRLPTPAPPYNIPLFFGESTNQLTIWRKFAVRVNKIAVRVKKTRQNKKIREPGSDSIRTDQALVEMCSAVDVKDSARGVAAGRAAQKERGRPDLIRYRHAL
jgi:hypothetical protein